MVARTLLALVALFATAFADNVLEEVIEDYLAAAEPEDGEKEGERSGKLGLGATYSDGDSRSLTIALNAQAIKEKGVWKLTLKFTSLYDESNGEESDNEHILTERLDYTLNEVSSIFELLIAEHDNQEKLTIRLILSVGYTRHIIKKEEFNLWIDIGPGVIYEVYRRQDDNLEMGLVLAVRFKWALGEKLVWEQNISFFPSLNYGGEGRIWVETTLTSPLSKTWSLQFIIRNAYNSRPPPGNVHNDFTAILTLVMTF